VIRVLTLALLLLSPLASLAGPDEAVKIANVLEAAETKDGAGALVSGWGSGTVVQCKEGWAYILTNKHVAPDRGDYLFVWKDGKSYRAEWVAADSEADLALIRIRAKLPAAKLAGAVPKVGEECQQWGFPGAGRMRAKSGQARERGSVKDTSYKETDKYDPLIVGYQAEHGESGSGVFNEAGELVGVCYRLFVDHPGYAGCVRLADVRRFLEANGVK
jgi:S1-C subfamily serine protease